MEYSPDSEKSEIEVTEEMIAIGVSEFSKYVDPDFPMRSPEDIVRKIFLAMTALALQRSP